MPTGCRDETIFLHYALQTLMQWGRDGSISASNRTHTDLLVSSPALKRPSAATFDFQNKSTSCHWSFTMRSGWFDCLCFLFIGQWNCERRAVFCFLPSGDTVKSWQKAISQGLACVLWRQIRAVNVPRDAGHQMVEKKWITSSQPRMDLNSCFNVIKSTAEQTFFFCYFLNDLVVLGMWKTSSTGWTNSPFTFNILVVTFTAFTFVH